MASLQDTINKIQSTYVAKNTLSPSIMTELQTASVKSSNANVSPDETFVRSNNYEWYENYQDTNYSTVDNTTKSIKVNPAQLSITQEENSQVIPFTMDRYWEGMDLTQMSLRIHFKNKDKDESFAVPINVEYSDYTIRFIWLLDILSTQVAGDLTFEIMATGVNEKGNNYTWRTLPDGKLIVKESLSGNGAIKPSDDWLTQYFNDIDLRIAKANEAVNLAEAAATRALEAANSTDEKIANVKDTITTSVMESLNTELLKHYTKAEVDQLLANIDITDQLADLEAKINNIDGLKNLKFEQDEAGNSISVYNGETLIKTLIIDKTPSVEWTTSFKSSLETVINTRVNALQDEFTAYKTSNDASLKKLQNKTDELTTFADSLNQNYYNKTETDEKLKAKANSTDLAKTANDITLIKSDITALEESTGQTSENIATLQQDIKDLQARPGNEYDMSIIQGEESVTWKLLENGEVKSQGSFTGGGGGGGSTETSTITIDRITKSPLTVVKNDSVVIEFNFMSVDNVGDQTGDAIGSWKVGNTVVANTTISQGKNSFDVTKYLVAGVNNIKLTVTDSFGSISTKPWSINVIEMYLESNFDDSLFYDSEVAFRYTPYGDIDKTVHFILDGAEIAGVTTAVTGRQMTQAIPKQSHGSHLLEVYATATIGSTNIESEHIFKDIIWIDTGNTTPIIGCSYKSFTTLQYNTINIPYVVYSPTGSTAQVTLSVDDAVVSTLTVDRTRQTWSYKSSTVGEHILKITCGNTVKSITGQIEDLGIDISPITTNLVFDLNPTGKSNNDEARLVINDSYSLQVSDNFDWTNGGYQLDSEGNPYFCVKAGTTATVPYHLFSDDARKIGKNFKVIFKATNVRNYDANVLSCVQSNIGIQMKAQNTTLNSEQTMLDVPYVEDEIIEFEFNIRPDSEHHEIITYEDGTPSRAKIYSPSDNFTQNKPVPIVVGSEDCDVWVYRMKAYTMALTKDEVKTNFIADGKNADEIIERYVRNNILNSNGELDPDLTAEKCKDLRIIKLSAPTFTTGKKNEVAGTTVQQIYKNGREVHDNWVATGSHKGQGTTSNQYGEAGRNIDINLSGGFTFGDGSTGTKYAMTENSVPVNYLNIKVNVASSEGINNAILADRYNRFNPYLREARINNTKVRDTMEFHPCVVFIQETDTTNANEFRDGKWHFYACGCIGNSKKNWEAFGNDQSNPLEVIVEVDNNTSDQARFLSDDLSAETWDGDGNFEFRYEAKNITEEQRTTNKQNWQRFLTWVKNATPETFVTEFNDYCVKKSCLFFYLFTEFYTMVDNRAKNVFWHTEDGIHWDLCFDYDNDTAMGNNNEGNLSLRYGYEDTDKIGTKDVFNAADSKFFCYVRDYMYNDLKELYLETENDGCWDSEALIKECDTWQNCYPEILWIYDLERKYFRPYESNGTTTYLEEMMYGKKKYQRRQFLRYQQPYMASKYMSAVCTANSITMRGYTPTSWTGVAPSGNITITPYADMYICCMFGSSTTRMRAKRGQVYTIENPIDAMNDTEMYVYTASMIQAIGDLSACYIGYCNFANAVKLQEVTIGSHVSGYQNTNLTTFNVGSNPLLERLNLENLPNLKQAINLSECQNLQEFFANGSGITGVLFASGGKLRIAQLPNVLSLTAKNLIYLEDLTFEDYKNLSTVVIENCNTINVLDLFEKAPNINRIRLTGISWNLDSIDFLDKLYSMSGVDENGYNINQSALIGNIHVPVMKQKKLNDYILAWPGVEFSYDTLVVQFTVVFVNYDGTVLDTQYVDIGGDAVDPMLRDDNPIGTPIKVSTVSTDYTFAGWDTGFKSIFSDRTIVATYTESLRMYTLKYVSKGTVLQENRGEYGSNIPYAANIPIYTAEESAYVYHLFKGWDKSGFIDGDKTVNAIFDRFEYSDGCFDNIELVDLKPVQIYAMLKIGKESELLTYRDNLTLPMGYDYSYQDIEEHVLINQETVFTGKNYIDTEIKLFEEDRDWVLAIDYKWTSENPNNAVLAQCYQSDGSNGFKLWYSTQPKITWATTSSPCAAIDKRDVIVLRHVKGDTKLYVYKGNLPASTIEYTELTSNKSALINSPLVFGCARADDGIYENYAIGAIYWSKLWYADLGDDACRTLASWIHESIPLEVAGFKKYYLSDNSGRRCSISLLASQLLSNTLPLNTSTANTGGWAKMTLNTFLNSRFYNSIRPEWRQLLKQVKITTTIGDKSAELSTSNCFISIPAIVELDSTMQYEPYSFEGETIPYIISQEDRIRKTADNVATEYFTRSPNQGYQSYIFTINESGEPNPYAYGLYDKGVLIQIFM